MLIRLVVENLFSFGEQKEFTTIPNNRLKTFNEHKYKIGKFNLLKISSIYGANGAGKSNLVKSLELLRDLVLERSELLSLRNTQFKFNRKDKKQLIAVEFVQDSIAFYYGVEFFNNVITTEELYLSGLGTKKDKLLYERKTNNKKITTVTFFKAFEQDSKSRLLKSILLEEFISPHKLLLPLLSNKKNKFLDDVKKAFTWFKETLQIISPDSAPVALAHRIDINENLRRYAEKIMCSFHVGITSLNTEKQTIEEFFGDNNHELMDQVSQDIAKNSNKIIRFKGRNGAVFIVLKEGETIWVKRLRIGHTDDTLFELEEESDGTVRLLDFVPAFYEMLTRKKVFVVDEIERSIHPLLIKELIKKFSLDSTTKGQLIFTTHESNLLDQEIFRQDEIWFAEKNKKGSTDLYSLSDFKEHKTIDIRKGYLSGRYGAIPFLANLQDLNWHKDVTEE